MGTNRPSAIDRQSSSSARWLVRGGTMGEAIRTFDWSATPLGPIHSWPHALRVAVGLCLNTRFPTFLWWGPDLVNLYNDAYIPILGKRHPHGLGRCAREVWHEVWYAVAPQVEAVFERAEASWQERLRLVTNRNGYDEDAYFTYSHSPVFDDDGQVAGLLCVVSEETVQVHTEEALRESEARFRLMADAVPQIVWVTDTEGRTEFFNRHWSEYTGAPYEPTTAGEIASRFVHPDDRLPTMEAFGRAQQSGTTFEVEHRIRSASGDYRWFLVRAEPHRDPHTRQVVRWFGCSTDIHDRKQAEEARRVSEQRLQRVLETDAVGVLFLDGTGTIVHANEVFLRMTGFTKEDVAGRELTRRMLTPPEWVAVTEHQLERFAATGRIGPYEKECLHKDGTRSWMLFAGRDLGDGTISEYCIDISEHKRAGEALRASEAKYRALFESMDEGFCILEVILDNQQPVDYRFLEVNPVFEAQTGLRNPRGRTARQIVPDLEQHWFEIYGKVALTGEATRFVNHSESMNRWFDVYAFRIGDPEERRVALLFRDITEPKRMAQALAASEERLQQVFAQAPVAVAVLRGRDLVFELANPSYQEFLPDRELLGRSLLVAMPEINPELIAILHRVLDTGELFVGHEYLVPLERDGALEDHWFTFVYQPWRQFDGTVVGIVVMALDVTTHVRARRELERVNKELEEFAYVASHDLQEPLRMVNIYSRLLVKRFGAESPEAEEYANFVHQGVRRMEALIKDLLTYSRTIQREDLVTDSANLTNSLNEALAVLQSRIEENGAVFTISPLPSVRGDTGQLAHVFQNLVSNALKYRRTESPPEVRIAARRENDHWVISVSDNGIGFEQKHAERIFGLFKRLHKDEYPGTGLGLAICQRIVERYGGHMWAEGRKGEGSTFYFALPASDPE